MELSRFYIKHSTNKQIKEASGPIVWQTCLRTIYFDLIESDTEVEFESADFEIYQGMEAYKFLLEVICGLKSPMIGETEVFGQFKNYIEGFEGQSIKADQILKILIDIRNSSKKIRAEHLIHLGAQSYGSLLRKKIDFTKCTHIIGAGQFVEDIIPWLSKKSDQIFIHSRRPHFSEQKPLFKNLKHMPLNAKNVNSGTLIIAAPLSASELQSWIGASQFDCVFDLRGASESDPLCVKTKVFSLSQFFQQIENNKSQIDLKVVKANKMIEAILDNILKSQKLNPFGWDDLCA